MKKLLITSALTAAFAAPAWANDSTIDQIGLTNNATVTQSGGTGGSSYVKQTGDNDTTWVVQSETSPGGVGTNISTVNQLSGSGSQSVSVNQNYQGGGAANVATVLQDSIEGGNSVTVNQNGDANLAEAQQGPGDAENCTLVFGCSSVTPLGITDSSSNVLQTGTANIAKTNQIVGSNGGSNNHASVNQDGTSNEGTIAQGTGSVNALGFFSPSIPNPASNDNDNFAWIDQTGVANESSIAQGGESGSASNTQMGNDNDSVIVQSGGLPGIGNLATVDQTGDRNVSTVTQTSLLGDIPVSPAGVKAIVTQNGDDNTSTITQNDLGGHTATVMQVGFMHTSSIIQDGLVNTATVTQELNNQTSEIFQTGPLLAPAIGNTATVNQTATANNFSHVTQSGTVNTTTVMQ